MTAIVFGSINMDLVARSPRLPGVGETVMGSTFLTTPGGKGANQAVALAQLGIPTCMVGRVGKDGFGQELLASLQRAGVQTDWVRVDDSTHSGVAMIAVSDAGENQIIGVPGANGRMGASDAEQVQGLIANADALVLQLEVPLPAVKAAAQVAHAAGVRVILDPAPVPPDPIRDLYPLVDILLPNQVEAEQLVGFPVNDRQAAEQAAIALQRQGASTVIVKLGAQGAFCATPEESFFVPAFPVAAVDTVAAGDAFAGGLVAALVKHLPLRQAVVWGAAAGALAVTQMGAQAAMPEQETFAAFLEKYADRILDFGLQNVGQSLEHR
jgi:ribokinase